MRRRLVSDGGHWYVYIDVVVQGLDFPMATAPHWVCLGYYVEAQEQVVTISFL